MGFVSFIVKQMKICVSDSGGNFFRRGPVLKFDSSYILSNLPTSFLTPIAVIWKFRDRRQNEMLPEFYDRFL